ncbi:hypothetical protein BEL04_15945 [Mucilaginibacter sp. PPCGB 2223]|uniref:energy transducer TonB n=1 Tax=Mucilaginibacter sp. PPCGB 2223 TaxID=1886027 RepID=UPI000825685C|nr:energy transducer TonB [Mucilaginibacter sp. PPCGB 2223]OCX51516.1 hypothetical protein BEL04_15945 [Mucilaginibacter sp. PPCGB 2223]
MAINNVDIYGDEWLELVFANRNKSYGAYELRKHYSATVLKALAVTFGFFGVVAFGAFLLLKPAPIAARPIGREVTTVLQPIVIARPEAAAPVHHSHHHTRNGHTYSPAPAVQANPQPQTSRVPAGTVNVLPSETGGSEANRISVIEDKTVYSPANADEKPLPVGGAQGWMNYLQKNLVYPEDARQKKISGRVELSFIVEKDGRISDITVEQPAGHGFDEEAVRVLQQSPAWQPGIKDGQPVRIRYHLPVSFRMMK